MAILTCVSCYLIAVLICISLIISDICQLFHLQIFSLGSEYCLFILFMVSLAVQKLLNLIRSHLFIFVFIFVTLGGQSSCCNLNQTVFCLCFPLRVLWRVALYLGL